MKSKWVALGIVLFLQGVLANPSDLCLKKAMSAQSSRDLNLDFSKASRLCRNALTAELPIQCFLGSYQILQNLPGSMADLGSQFCSGVRSVETLHQCYRMATQVGGGLGTSLSPRQSIRLCAGVENLQILRSCFHQNYFDSLHQNSLEDVIEFCRQN